MLSQCVGGQAGGRQCGGLGGAGGAKQGLHRAFVQALHPGKLGQAVHIGQRRVTGNDIELAAQGHDLQALAGRVQGGKVLPLGL